MYSTRDFNLAVHGKWRPVHRPPTPEVCCTATMNDRRKKSYFFLVWRKQWQANSNNLKKRVEGYSSRRI